MKVGHLFYWSASEDVVNIASAQDIILTISGYILMSAFVVYIISE